MTSVRESERIAFLGLGLMGMGMARRLIAAGFPITVFNRTASKSESLAAEGARVALSPHEAAADADIVISMLADDAASGGVWLGAAGALTDLKPGALLIECSTVSPEWIRELAAAAAARGCDLLDAPVTGSRTQAADGGLKFLVGGTAEALERGRNVLRAMGQTIVHAGPAGSGATLKLVNNFLCGVQAASTAEALAWLERSGLDVPRAVEVLASGAPGSPIVQRMLERMAAREFAPHFHLELMSKDLRYALHAAEAAGIDLATARASYHLYRRAVDAGLGTQDMSAIIEPLRGS